MKIFCCFPKRDRVHAYGGEQRPSSEGSPEVLEPKVAQQERRVEDLAQGVQLQRGSSFEQKPGVYVVEGELASRSPSANKVTVNEDDIFAVFSRQASPEGQAPQPPAAAAAAAVLEQRVLETFKPFSRGGVEREEEKKATAKEQAQDAEKKAPPKEQAQDARVARLIRVAPAAAASRNSFSIGRVEKKVRPHNARVARVIKERSRKNGRFIYRSRTPSPTTVQVAANKMTALNWLRGQTPTPTSLSESP